VAVLLEHLESSPRKKELSTRGGLRERARGAVVLGHEGQLGAANHNAVTVLTDEILTPTQTDTDPTGLSCVDGVMTGHIQILQEWN
jgi:hypothetical protein